jgi:hypothetical protein
MQAPNRIRRALRKDLTKGVSTYASRCKGGVSPAGGNQLPPVLEGSSPLTAACPSLEGRSGDGWMSCPEKRQEVTVQTCDGSAPPAPLS